MRIALLSDIHGNIYAFEAILAALEHDPVDHVLFAGDSVGYYPFVNEVLGRLRSVSMTAVLGNHEMYLLNPEMLPNEKWEAYRLEDARQSILPDNLDWLHHLPERHRMELDGLRIILCHGSPWSIDEYVYPNFNQWDRFNDLHADVIVLGHTHVQFRKEVGPMQIVNPGSCGQPRDYRPGACYSVLDTRTREIAFHREPYDIQHLIGILKSRDFPDSLTRILIRNRHCGQERTNEQ